MSLIEENRKRRGGEVNRSWERNKERGIHKSGGRVRPEEKLEIP